MTNDEGQCRKAGCRIRENSGKAPGSGKSHDLGTLIAHCLIGIAQTLQKSTPKAFHIIAQGRGAAAHPGFAKSRFVYAEGVTQNVTRATLYKVFGVSVGLVHHPGEGAVDLIGLSRNGGILPPRIPALHRG